MHICSSWLYTWLPTSDNIKTSGEQAKAKISSAYTKISLFLLQFYFLSFYFFPTFLLERVADPIQNQPFVKLQFAPLGLVPKKMETCDLSIIYHTQRDILSMVLLIQGPVLFITQALMRQQA